MLYFTSKVIIPRDAQHPERWKHYFHGLSLKSLEVKTGTTHPWPHKPGGMGLSPIWGRPPIEFCSMCRTHNPEKSQQPWWLVLQSLVFPVLDHAETHILSNVSIGVLWLLHQTATKKITSQHSLLFHRGLPGALKGNFVHYHQTVGSGKWGCIQNTLVLNQFCCFCL